MQNIVDNSSVFHFWANQVQEHASNQKRSIHFDTTKLYSYSLLIANIVNPETVLIHISDNSATTNKHISRAYSAVNHKNIIVCPTIDPVYTFDHKNNLDYFKREIHDHLLKSERARSGSRKQWTYNSAINNIKMYNDYCRCFKLRRKVLTIESYDLSKIVELNKKERLLLTKKKRVEKLKLIKDNNKKIKQWKTGDRVYLSHELPVFLRVNKDNATIETSKGANVPLSYTAILWRKVQQCINDKKCYTPDYNHTDKIGVYALDSIAKNGDIMIGCHNIKYSELQSIAQQLNYKGV